MTRVMRSLLKLGLIAIALTPPLAQAHTEDDPLLMKVLVDLAWQPTESKENLEWDTHLWVGKDLNKLWLKTEGEIGEGETEEAHTQLLYGRAVAPYWDVLVGWRRDFKPGAKRDWLALGAHGLAPYFLETEITAFADGDGAAALSLEVERELMITQTWALAPHIEANFYGQNDPIRGLGSGLAILELGLKLHYELRREVAPFVGVKWEKAFGNTADYRQQAGEPTQEHALVVGVHAWF